MTLLIVAAPLFNVSLINTFAKDWPPIPAIIVFPTSFTASITAADTGTITVAESQLPEFNFSQIWYVIV